MSALHGPAEAGNFRVKVGRYGDRWYTDPLPACELAPASDWQGPSVSATKPPFANKFVPMRGIADMPDTEWARLTGLSPDDRYEAIKTADKITSRINMARGTIVHQWAEDRLNGRAAIEGLDLHDRKALEQAERFRPALEQFFDHHQPELVAAEVVCLHRTLNGGIGYGGTADAFVRIDGDVWAVDWKSRNSDHGAYLEEAAQGGAYVGAEYMIVAGPDGAPARAPIPQVAGVLIVSIREDGYRAYPIDRDGAVAAYRAMHRWWCAQQRFTADKVIGRPWPPKATIPDAPTAPDDAPTHDRADVVAAVKAIVEAGHAETLTKRWPEGVPGFATDHAHTPAELAAITDAVRSVNKDRSMPFTAVDADVIEAAPEPAPAPDPPSQPTKLDDGRPVTLAARDNLNNAYAALEPDARAAVDNLRTQMPAWPATPTGVGPLERHWNILRAAVLWARAGWDNDILSDLTAAVTDNEAVRQPAMPIGTAWAALTIDQANTLAEMAQQVLDGTHQATHNDRWTLSPAA